MTAHLSPAAWPFPSERKRAEMAQLEAAIDRPFEVEKPEAAPAELGTHQVAKAALAPANLNILALDLATQCGWAVMTRDGTFRSGSKRFDRVKLGGNGARWLAFREWLMATARQSDGIQAVYYEDVRRHVSNLSARVYCGYLAILEAWAEINKIPLHGVGVGTVKKAWTGAGNASKADMIAAARKRGIKVVDDNEADAIAILSLALELER
ncbi:hypothetical protein [Ralstonia insidiosa]